MKESDENRREFCSLHGWVGRRVFQRDRHDLCEDPADSKLPAEDEENEEDKDSLVSGDNGDTDDIDDIDDTEGNDDAETTPEPEGDRQRWSRAAARRQGIPPKKTLAVRRITQVELAAGRAELQALGADEPYDRPKTRGDCARVPRPCPYVACKQNLFLDVSDTGSIILNFPHLEPGQMNPDQSCALDLADRGAMTLEDIAVVTNLTRERIRQVEMKALTKRARPAAIAAGLGPDDAADLGGRHCVGPSADLEETGVEGAVPSDVATLLISGGGGSDS